MKMDLSLLSPGLSLCDPSVAWDGVLRGLAGGGWAQVTSISHQACAESAELQLSLPDFIDLAHKMLCAPVSG